MLFIASYRCMLGIMWVSFLDWRFISRWSLGDGTMAGCTMLKLSWESSGGWLYPVELSWVSWLATCLVNVVLLVNVLLHPGYSQTYGRFPVWTLLCRASEEESLNALSQISHLWGFSPVWTRIWTVRADLWINCFPQRPQTFGLTPVWIRSCLTKSDRLENFREQVIHANCFCTCESSSDNLLDLSVGPYRSDMCIL